MFLRRVGLPFVGKQLEAADQAGTGSRRFDDFVHIPQFGCPVWVGELFTVIIL